MKAVFIAANYFGASADIGHASGKRKYHLNNYAKTQQKAILLEVRLLTVKDPLVTRTLLKGERSEDARRPCGQEQTNK